jgi:hypothetical protein
MCRGAPIMQWEIEDAQEMRACGHTWRDIGLKLRRDHNGIRRALIRHENLIHTQLAISPGNALYSDR